MDPDPSVSTIKSASPRMNSALTTYRVRTVPTMRHGLGRRAHIVTQVHVPQEKDALPGHQDVVEKHRGVHLFKL